MLAETDKVVVVVSSTELSNHKQLIASPNVRHPEYILAIFASHRILPTIA